MQQLTAAIDGRFTNDRASNFVNGPREDGVQCELQIREKDKVLGSIRLDAQTLSQLISQLASNRSAMTEPVPRNLQGGAKAAIMSQPEWHVPNDPAPNARILLLRHSGYGWVAFHMTQDRAKKIAGDLNRDGIGFMN